jgi:hypothetical protein
MTQPPPYPGPDGPGQAPQYPQQGPPAYGQPGTPPGYPPGYPPAYPPGYPPGYPPYAAPPKKRPSALWFIPGAVALALAIACVVVAIVTGVKMFHTDGYVSADGTAHSFDLSRGSHMLFAQDGSDPPAGCTAQDSSGALALDTLDSSNTETVSAGGYDWYPFARFSSDGSAVSVTCSGDGAQQVRVGAPAGETQFVILGFSAIGAIGLGLLGLAGVIIVLVLYVSRRPKKGLSA